MSLLFSARSDVLNAPLLKNWRLLPDVLELLDPEDEGIEILQNVTNYSFIDIPSHPISLYLHLLLILLQYGAFLMIIFLLEISAGISIYAYRDKLLDGFGKGLNQSLANYKTDQEKASDFDLMQSTVSLRHMKALVSGQTKTSPSLGRWQFKAMEIALAA